MSKILRWTKLQCSCCDTRIPILSLCDACLQTKITTIEPLEKKVPKPNNVVRHRLEKREALPKFLIECSVCKNGVESLIFCLPCSKEVNDLIISVQASEIVKVIS